MPAQPTDGTAPTNSISRRTLAKGAAWAVPAVLIAAPAPAFAASLRKDPGINGWVLNTTDPQGRCSYTLEVDSTLSDTGPDGAPFGLYLYDTESTDVITNAKLTYWIIGDQQAAATRLGGHSNCWSDPVRGTPQTKADGLTYTPYTFTYSASAACAINTAANRRVGADGVERLWLGHFHVRFSFTQPRSLCNNVTYWTQRSIDIDIKDGNGPQTLTFERRNGTLGPYSGSGDRRQQLDEQPDLAQPDELSEQRAPEDGLLEDATAEELVADS